MPHRILHPFLIPSLESQSERNPDPPSQQPRPAQQFPSDSRIESRKAIPMVLQLFASSKDLASAWRTQSDRVDAGGDDAQQGRENVILSVSGGREMGQLEIVRKGLVRR